jgi:uncharacterized protein
VTCPICGKDAEAKYRPFCSRRCADVDLGRWLTGSYALPPRLQKMRPQALKNGMNPPQPRARNSLLGKPAEGEFSAQYPLDSPRPPDVSPRHPRGSAPLGNGAQIAQLVEQRIENPRVAGSIPALGTT